MKQRVDTGSIDDCTAQNTGRWVCARCPVGGTLNAPAISRFEAATASSACWEQVRGAVVSTLLGIPKQSQHVRDCDWGVGTSQSDLSP